MTVTRLAALAAVVGAACLLVAPSLACAADEVATTTPITLGSGVPPPTPIDRTFEGAPTNGSPLFLGRDAVHQASMKSYGATRNRTPGAVPDADIERNINTVLSARHDLDGQVEVHSNGGLVKVTGRVASTGMVYRIIALIEGVDGVVGVDEQGLDVI